MIVTKSWIAKNYQKYNKLYFDNVLPDVEFKISRSKTSWGRASYYLDTEKNEVTPISIAISNYYDSPEKVKLSVLLHEMIHIYDYFINPNHFVNNNTRVKNYDAHGDWFKNECDRIYKISGIKINTNVTDKEQKKSKLSENTLNNIKNQKETALVCVVKGSISNWLFKTNTWQLKTALNTIKNITWNKTIGEFKNVDIYKFNDDKLASERSCGKLLRGWKFSNDELFETLNNIKAIKIKEVV